MAASFPLMARDVISTVSCQKQTFQSIACDLKRHVNQQIVAVAVISIVFNNSHGTAPVGREVTVLPTEPGLAGAAGMLIVV